MLQIDNDELKRKFDHLGSYVDYYNLYGQPLVDEYAGELDEKVGQIRTYLNSIREYDLEFDVPSLQKIVIDLSSCIYFTNDRLEKLNLLSDLSKMKYKDQYNDSYTRRQGAATVENRKYTTDQLRALAEQETIEESVVSSIYVRQAAVLKNKVDSANELLRACSKVLTGCIESSKTYQFSNRYTT